MSPDECRNAHHAAYLNGISDDRLCEVLDEHPELIERQEDLEGPLGASFLPCLSLARYLQNPCRQRCFGGMLRAHDMKHTANRPRSGQKRSAPRKRSATFAVEPGSRRAVAISATAIVPVPSRRRTRNFDATTRRQLGQIQETLRLSVADLGKVFGVTRQAVDQWRTASVPVDKAAAVDRVAECVEELARRFKPQRLPAVAREPLPILCGRSILQTLQTDGPAAIYEFFRRWSSYLPRVEPIRPGQYH